MTPRSKMPLGVAAPSWLDQFSCFRCFDKNGIGSIARQELHSVFEVGTSKDPKNVTITMMMITMMTMIMMMVMMMMKMMIMLMNRNE